MEVTPQRPRDLVDRENEWRRLSAMWSRPRPELVFVTGRRRVGKSHLLTRFAQAVGGLYYQATRRTESEQLASLSRVLGTYFGDAALAQGATLPDWEALFEYSIARSGGDPLLLVLDEFPFLAASAPALPSIVQAVWDHRLTGTRVKLVLSGSHITAMRRLEAGDQPLYGRRTARLMVRPFDFRDAGRFFPDYDAMDALRAYGIFGGLPGSLALVDGGRGIGSNVATHLLSPDGRLVDEAQHFLDAFLADAAVHYSVIEAIARGERTWRGISARVGRTGGGLQRALRWLEEMDILDRVVPFTESRPEKSKRVMYRITDPYLAFWHRLVSPLISTGVIGLVDPHRIWRRHIAPKLDDHLGPVFEDVCRQYVRRPSALPFEPMKVGEWWSPRGDEQIDVVAEGDSGELLVAECKWGRIRTGDLAALRTRADTLMAGLRGVRRVHLALFSGRGEFDDAVRAAAAVEDLLLVSGDDLFADSDDAGPEPPHAYPGE